MPPFSFKVVCAIGAAILAVLVLLTGDEDTARRIVFLAVMGLVLAVGLVAP